MTELWLRRETIGDCTLLLGDAMAILPSLAGVQLMVSDVPYALTTGGKAKSQKTMSGIFAAHNYDNDGQLVAATVPFSDMMAAMYAAMADDGDCYVMCNDKNVYPLTAAAFSAGFRFHNLLTWNKITATANRWYMKNLEFTLYLWKGRARTINNPGSKQTFTGGQRSAEEHPTQKPIELMGEYVLNSSEPGWLVCDPFMGSGTTGVACVRTGRRFVGIEIDETHFETACERIAKASQTAWRAPGRAPDLFSEVAG